MRDTTFEVRDITAFRAVVDALSIRRAALQLGLQPSAVSRRIRALEDRLGASLFERTTQGVRLTDAGNLFLAGARDISVRIDDLARLIMEAGAGRNGRIRIGMTGPIASADLEHLISRFKVDHISVEIELLEGTVRDNLSALLRRAIDVAFVANCPPVEVLQKEEIWHETMMAVLPTSHPQAHRKQVSVSDIAEEQFIFCYNPPGPEMRRYVEAASVTDITPLRIKHLQVDRGSIMHLVGMGLGVSLACESETRIGYPNVAFIPLSGKGVMISVVWLPQNDNPPLRRFLSLGRKEAMSKRSLEGKGSEAK